MRSMNHLGRCRHAGKQEVELYYQVTGELPTRRLQQRAVLVRHRACDDRTVFSNRRKRTLRNDGNTERFVGETRQKRIGDRVPSLEQARWPIMGLLPGLDGV